VNRLVDSPAWSLKEYRMRQLTQLPNGFWVPEPCTECSEGALPNGSACQECCDHEFDSGEGYMCLNCDKEGLEDVMCAAYDRAKASRDGY
jgi:hypothetical protein